MLHGKADQNRYLYISPKPGTKLVSKDTNIIIRPGQILTVHSIDATSFLKVKGSISGIHTGDVIISDDDRTIVFRPRRVFEAGERVSVWIHGGLRNQNGDEMESTLFHFTISPKRGESTGESMSFPEVDGIDTIQMNNSLHASSRSNGYILPVDFPEVEITVSEEPDSGYIFLTNFMAPKATPYMMILDNTGFPIFFQRITHPVVDFKKQPNGLLTYYFFGTEMFYALDTSYTIVDSFQCGNGYTTDFHDLQILPNGNALLMSHDTQIVDLSHWGGDTAATVIGLIVQEMDQDKNVVFQWRSWDHFQITDATHHDITQKVIDYVHGDAIEVDSDGNLLISCRNLDEITKINRQTGEIIWRLGGKNNQFTFVNDTTMFYRQHDIRRLPNGNITLFDNGNFHSPPYSRAVEYHLDETNKIATLVWEYRNSPDIFVRQLGNMQRLPNDNTFIGWGMGNTTATEVRSDGSKAFELRFVNTMNSYRVFRFPWKGIAAAPTLWADTTAEEVTLHFTRFGATNIVKYFIYGGQTPAPMTRIDSTTGNSFVPKNLTGGKTCYFRVTTLDDQRNESYFSNEVEVTMDTSTAVESLSHHSPGECVLFQNYPNPFNPATTIRYGVPTDLRVLLRIYNILGQEIRTLFDGKQKAGYHSMVWDGKDGCGRGVTSGIYIYQLQTDIQVVRRKMLLFR